MSTAEATILKQKLNLLEIIFKGFIKSRTTFIFEANLKYLFSGNDYFKLPSVSCDVPSCEITSINCILSTGEK